MPEQSAGSAAQTRAIAEQVAETAITRFAEKHPEVRRGTVTAEIPAPLKWAAIIFSSVITVSASGGLIWLVSSVSEMSVTLARMDERMAGYTDAQADRNDTQDQQIRELQSYHRNGGR